MRALQAIMGLPWRQLRPCLLLLVVLVWPQPCTSLGEWGVPGWVPLARFKGLGHLPGPWEPAPSDWERQPQGQWALGPHPYLLGRRAHPLHAADNSLGPGREGHGHHVFPGAAALCPGRARQCCQHCLAGGGLQQRYVLVQAWG